MHARSRPVERCDDDDDDDGHSVGIVHANAITVPWTGHTTQLWQLASGCASVCIMLQSDQWSRLLVGWQTGGRRDKDAVQEALFALRARIRRERQMRSRTDADVSGVRAIVSERLDERAPCAAADRQPPPPLSLGRGRASVATPPPIRAPDRPPARSVALSFRSLSRSVVRLRCRAADHPFPSALVQGSAAN